MIVSLTTVALMMVAGYREHTLHEFRTALDSQETDRVQACVATLARFGWLESAMRTEYSGALHNTSTILWLIGKQPEHFVPVLLELLDESETPTVRRHVVMTIESLSWTSLEAQYMDPIVLTLADVARRDAEPDVRGRALQVYCRCRPAGETGVPDFVEDAFASDDDYLRACGTHALVSLAPGRSDECVDVLRDLIDAQDDDLSRLVDLSLAALGERASALEPDLLAMFGSPDFVLRSRALRYLRTVGAESDELVAALRGVLRAVNDGTNGFEQDVSLSFSYLAELGPRASAAVPELVAAAEVRWLRPLAVQTLGKVAPTHALVARSTP